MDYSPNYKINTLLTSPPPVQAERMRDWINSVMQLAGSEQLRKPCLCEPFVMIM